jgi:hypothetical protein
LQDIADGAAWSWPRELTASAGALFFAAADATHGRELWRLDAADAPAP